MPKSSQRTPTPAEAKWSQRMNTEHLPPIVIRGFIQESAAALGGEHSQAHIEQCEECAWVFTALKSNKVDDVLVDYSFETREAMRQMWAVADERYSSLCDQFAAARWVQVWILLVTAVLLVLRLWR